MVSGVQKPKETSAIGNGDAVAFRDWCLPLVYQNAWRPRADVSLERAMLYLVKARCIQLKGHVSHDTWRDRRRGVLPVNADPAVSVSPQQTCLQSCARSIPCPRSADQAKRTYLAISLAHEWKGQDCPDTECRHSASCQVTASTTADAQPRQAQAWRQAATDVKGMELAGYEWSRALCVSMQRALVLLKEIGSVSLTCHSSSCPQSPGRDARP